ncbi:hypothetical protein C8R46DRAFT_1030569 [Mycena filopes]|nr:hypothetical protein C8R46DRAFT_1030569 [Mycena filopes]
MDTFATLSNSVMDTDADSCPQSTLPAIPPRRAFIRYPLPVEVTGSNRRQYLRVRASRKALDLDYCIIVRVVRVGRRPTGAGMAFARLTVHKYLPQPPRSMSDFIVPPGIRTQLPIDRRLLPPPNRQVANSWLTYTMGGPTHPCSHMLVRHGPDKMMVTVKIPQEEEFIDIRFHRSSVFCSVFTKVDGSYEVAQIFSDHGSPMILATTIIFAPCAWSGGAKVLQTQRVAAAAEMLLLFHAGKVDPVTTVLLEKDEVPSSGAVVGEGLARQRSGRAVPRQASAKTEFNARRSPQRVHEVNVFRAAMLRPRPPWKTAVRTAGEKGL